MNTFITECSEDTEADLKAGLGVCETTEQIVADLEVELARALEEGDDDTVTRCAVARRRLRDLTAEKVDRVSAHVLENAYDLSTELKEGVREAKVSHSCLAVKMGVWINITAKGGRYVCSP